MEWGRLPSGERLPALRTYMDDVTSILQTAPCTARLLKLMMSLPRWAHRLGKYEEGVRSDRTVFMAGGEKISLLAGQPIWSTLLTSFTNGWGWWCRSSWLMAWQGLMAANSPGNSDCGATNSHCSSVLRGHWETASPASLCVRPGLAGSMASIHKHGVQAGEGLTCIQTEGLQGPGCKEWSTGCPNRAQVEGQGKGGPSYWQAAA